MSTSTRPPAGRTELWRPITAAAAQGRLVLQQCGACGAWQYPPREVCRDCLGTALAWTEPVATGTVLAASALHASVEPWFKRHLPWLIGKVKLDIGPWLIVHLAADCAATGTRVRIASLTDASGQAVLVARAAGATAAADPRLAALGAAPD
ncbi:MAG: hypothetical protein IT495_11935 [Gammaproteobacteria bacterium]|nr:hypothetical protein [Gammaproteobacteria bacterium]